LLATSSIGTSPTVAPAFIAVRGDGDHYAAATAQEVPAGGFRAALSEASDEQAAANDSSPLSGGTKKDTKTKKVADAQAKPAAVAPGIAPSGLGGSLPLLLQPLPDSGSSQSDSEPGSASELQPATDDSVGVSGVMPSHQLPAAARIAVSAVEAQVPADSPLPALPDATTAPSADLVSQSDPAVGQSVPQTDQVSPTADQTAPLADPSSPMSAQPASRLVVPDGLRLTWSTKSAAGTSDSTAPTGTSTGLAFALRLKPQSAATSAGDSRLENAQASTSSSAEPGTPVRLAANVTPLPPAATTHTEAVEESPSQPRGSQVEQVESAGQSSGSSPADASANSRQKAGGDSNRNGAGTSQREDNPTTVKSPAAGQPEPGSHASRPEVDAPANSRQTAGGGGNRNGAGASQRETTPATVKSPAAGQPKPSSHASAPEVDASAGNSTAAAPAASSAPADILGNPLAFHASSPVGPAVVDSSAPAAPAAPAATETKVPAAPVHSAQEIAVSVASNNDQKVEVRLVERAGEVHVSVRTTDETLAHTMREDLGSLTGKLAQNGFGAEAYSPARAESSSFSNQRGASENQDSKGGQQQGSRQGGESSQQQSQQESRDKRPAWLEAMESSLAQNQTNRSATWPLNR
jgi:hypothetical protein